MKKFVRFLISLVLIPFIIFMLLPMVCIIEYIEEDDADKEISKQVKRDILTLGWRWLTFGDYKKTS